MFGKLFVLGAVLAVAGCNGLPQPSPRAAEAIGQTQSGKPIYSFRLTRANALGVSPIPVSAIRSRALEICPGGYTELARSAWAERRISGVIYTDVDVTVACN